VCLRFSCVRKGFLMVGLLLMVQSTVLPCKHKMGVWSNVGQIWSILQLQLS
jgi:hypothetical protein